MSGAQFFRCLNCQRLAKPDRCTQHNVILLEAAESVCRDFQNEAAPPVPQLDLDPNSLYLWIENPVTQQLELAALASFDFVRSWSSDEQRSMRAKRTQLRQFFRRAQL